MPTQPSYVNITLGEFQAEVQNLPDEAELSSPPSSSGYLDKYFYSVDEKPHNPSWGKYYWVYSTHPQLSTFGGYWQVVPSSGSAERFLWESKGGWKKLKANDSMDGSITGISTPLPPGLQQSTQKPQPTFKWWSKGKKTLTLFRGLPSSGKSSLSYLMWMGLRSECGSRRSIIRYDLDDFLAADPMSGEQNSPQKAHEIMQSKVEAAIHDQDDHLILSAPFFSKMEVLFYKQMAKKSGRMFSEIVCRGEFASLDKLKNLKGHFEL